MTDDVNTVTCWVRSVYICAMEIEWHDKRDQHGCLLDRMCLYAPIQNMNYREGKLGGMTDEVWTMLCWIRCVNMHQYENINYLEIDWQCVNS